MSALLEKLLSEQCNCDEPFEDDVMKEIDILCAKAVNILVKSVHEVYFASSVEKSCDAIKLPNNLNECTIGSWARSKLVQVVTFCATLDHSDSKRSHQNIHNWFDPKICRKNYIAVSALLDFTWQKIHTGHWKDVSDCWRDLYAWCAVCKSLLILCRLLCIAAPPLSSTHGKLVIDTEDIDEIDTEISTDKVDIQSQLSHSDSTKQSDLVHLANKLVEQETIKLSDSYNEELQLDIKHSGAAKQQRNTLLVSADSITNLAAMCVYTMDMGLLMGSPIKQSPLTVCAEILNPVARLSQPLSVRCPTFRSASKYLNTDEIMINSCKEEISPPSFGNNENMQNNCTVSSDTFVTNKVNIQNNNVRSHKKPVQTINWKPFRDVHIESLQSFFQLMSNETSKHTTECSNCRPDLLEASADSEHFAERVEELVQNTARCLCKDYVPPSNYHSEEPLHESIYYRDHPSLNGEGDRYVCPKDFNKMVTRPLTVERFISEDDLLHQYAYRDSAVKMLGLIDDWPCRRVWSVQYWRHVAGARTVPVEVGSRYTDADWGQTLMTLDKFLTEYVCRRDAPTAYLAQHDLLNQIPCLLEDITAPHHCWMGDTAPPRINAWLGPQGTVSPLHHDPDHNILAQVVGYKYIRLYAASESSKLYPHEDALLNNTSRVDVEGDQTTMREQFPLFPEAQYTDLILGPGECVYIPPKCWHYVRSLTVSCSVSFWFKCPVTVDG